MKMRVVFVSGPFRAANGWEIEQNIRRAEEVALELWRMGAAVICPHTNTRFYQGAAPDDVWLKGDLAILERCDAIVLIDGWSASEGAQAEMEHAIFREIEMFDWGVPGDRAALKEWIDAGSVPA